MSSIIGVTCRRTMSRARTIYPTALAIGGFLIVSAALFVFKLQAAEGVRHSVAAIWTACVAPVLPALAAFLAMDVFSDDLLTGRIDLLLSAAVREVDVVLGKLLGVYALLAITVGFLFVSTLLTLQLMAPGVLNGVGFCSFLPGLFALMLQGFLWVAISVAISALTRHGAIAATTSIILLVAMPRAFWAALTAWSATGRMAYGEMPLDAHAIDFSAGIFSTGTTLSYLVCAFVAIFISTQFVRMRRLIGHGARGLRASTIFSILLSIVFAALSGLLAARIRHNFDLSNLMRSVHFSSRLSKTLSESIGEITVTSFLSRKDPRFRSVAQLLRILKNEADATGGVRLNIRFVDPHWDMGAALRLIRQGASEASLVFETARRVAVVNLKDGYDESVCISAIRRVTLPPQRRNIYWTEGHGESRYDDYENFGMSDIARELSREGYTNQRLDINGNKQVPADSALVIVAGAREDFSRAELGIIDTYLKSGGRLLALLASEQGGVSPLLPTWGLRPQAQPLAEARTLSGNDAIVSDFTDHTIATSLKGTQIVLGKPLSLFPSAAAEGGVGADRLEFSSIAKIGTVAVAAAVERGSGAGTDLAIRPTRIVTIGDASFVMNGPLAARANANRDFFMRTVAYLAGADVMTASAAHAEVIAIGLDRVGRMRFTAVFCGILPLGVMGLLLLLTALRRREK